MCNNRFFDDNEKACFELIEKYGFDKDILVLDIAEFPNGRWGVQLLKDTLFLDFKVAYRYIMCYTVEKAVFFKDGERMTSKFTIEIPYDSRSKYINTVKEINKLIDSNGVFMIFINNMPYNPSSFLVIETHTNSDEIKEIIKDNNLTIVSNRGIEEFTYELAERKWDAITFIDDKSIDVAFKYGFHFAEKADFEQDV